MSNKITWVQKGAMPAKSDDCFVSGALAAVLKVSRIGGIAPLTFTKKRNGWSMSVSLRWNIYGYFLVTAFVLTTFVALLRDASVDRDESFRMRTNTRRIVWIVDVTLMTFMSGVAVFGSGSRMKSIIDCFNNLQKINSDLTIYHRPWFKKRNIAGIVVWMTVTASLIILDHVMLSLDFMSTTNIETTQAVWISVTYTFYYGCYWIQQLQWIQFIMISLHIYHTFMSINDNMRNILHELLDSNTNKLLLVSFYKFSHKNKVKKLSANAVDIATFKSNTGKGKNHSKHHYEEVHTLGSVYPSACDVVREVNRSHGLLLLLLLGSHFYHLVITPYYLINNLFDNKSAKAIAADGFYMILQILWCIFHAANLILVIEPCHMTHKQMEITQELISHLMCCTNSMCEPLAVELELFDRHLVLNQTSYSPLRVTTLSRPLVAAMFGSITTYLVVIVQL